MERNSRDRLSRQPSRRRRDEARRRDWDQRRRNPAIGKIIYIDQFGNITTNIEGNALKKIIDHDKKITLLIGNKKHELLFVKSYSYVKNKQILLTIGSNNLLEIAVNQGNAAKKLNIKINDEIKISFK